MMVPAIVDELNAANNIDEFLDVMTARYDLKSKEGLAAGQRCFVLTRPSEPDDSCAIQDECTITVVSEDHTLVGKAIDRLYPYGHRYCSLNISTNNPVYVEEKLPGFPVLVSKHGGTHLITTKQDLHGDNKMPSGINMTVAAYFMERINKLAPIAGIDCLYDIAWTSPIAWTFQFVPEKYNHYRLVLITGTDMDTGQELTKDQLDNLAQHHRIDRPKAVKIYGPTQIREAIRELLKENANLDEVIIRNQRAARAKYKIDVTDKIDVCKIGTRKYLTTVADCVMRDVTLLTPATQELFYLMKYNFDQLANEAASLHEVYKSSRTRYRYVKKIGNHPMAKVLFALRSNKIDSMRQIHRILTPVEFVKMIGRVDGHNLSKAIARFKEEQCQQTK